MACLTYTPSQIRYKDSTYSRMELIEAKKMILEGTVKANEVLEGIKNQRVCTSVPITSKRRASVSPLSGKSALFNKTNDEFPRLKSL